MQQAGRRGEEHSLGIQGIQSIQGSLGSLHIAAAAAASRLRCTAGWLRVLVFVWVERCTLMAARRSCRGRGRRMGTRQQLRACMCVFTYVCVRV